MVSRRTALTLAMLYEDAFTKDVRVAPTSWITKVKSKELYDFLYERGYPAFLMNMVWKLSGSEQVKRFVMQLHTGETLASASDGWSWSQRERAGQEYLIYLAQDLLVDTPEYIAKLADAGKRLEQLSRSLELDGYTLRGRKLIPSEASVLDEKEERGVLEQLVGEVALQNQKTGLHHLDLSEEHYLAGRWDDSIGNSRKFLEYVLQEAASRHHLFHRKKPIEQATFDSPGQVRKYLETAGLISAQERESIGTNYGLLSETGGHPYIAESEQARLMRHLALTLSQFVLLRLRGYLQAKAK